MSANLDGYNTPRRSTLKSKLEKRIEALELQVAMKKDVRDTVAWILSEFSFFDDNQLIWMCLDEITLEPVTGDPMETNLEPVFWLSSKDLFRELQLTESELIPYLGG
jgi:hypothetical protein